MILICIIFSCIFHTLTHVGKPFSIEFYFQCHFSWINSCFYLPHVNCKPYAWTINHFGKIITDGKRVCVYCVDCFSANCAIKHFIFSLIGGIFYQNTIWTSIRIYWAWKQPNFCVRSQKNVWYVRSHGFELVRFNKIYWNIFMSNGNDQVSVCSFVWDEKEAFMWFIDDINSRDTTASLIHFGKSCCSVIWVYGSHLSFW